MWKVMSLNTEASQGDFTDVVTSVVWNCTVRGDGMFGRKMGICKLPAPTDSFTNYADLTEDQVLAWCWANGVDKDATEAAVQTQIDNQKNPPIVTLPLPWAN